VLVMSHRGYWQSPQEKNTLVALERSFRLGLGTETDLRDCDRKLVISHDPADQESLLAERLFQTHRNLAPTVPLALNIKADGLQQLVVDALQQHSVKDAFVFDMSVPDMLRWVEAGVPVFTRHSELEPDPACYAQAAGVWLDAFRGEWWDVGVILRHCDAGKRVCIVSPELHRREHRPTWDKLLAGDIQDTDQVMICTDYPEEAMKVMGSGH
jgi:hypothetical protein